jgi:tetratricopeptide (TPR) repeat protein
MKCPNCGASNFDWARKCDDCGHRFRVEQRSTTPSAAAQGEPIVVETLDLQRHAANDIPGKTISINGAAYEILPAIRAIRGATVYALRHQRSRLVTFELKVFSCAAGSHEYDEIKRRGREVFREKVVFSTERDPGANAFVVEEIYEQNGGLVGLQRSFSTHPGPEYYETQMKKAATLINENRIADAIQEYDRVLALNPNHIAALGNKGVCLGRIGDIAGAARLFVQCIELDPNETTSYHNAATFLAGSGRPESATAILAKGLNRYAGEFGTWMLLVRLATEYDTLALVDDVVERGMTLVADSEAGRGLRQRIDESRIRWQRYCAALEQATRMQLSKQWDEALQLLAQAAALSKRNAVAELNCCICLFQKGDLDASFRRTQACQFRLDGNHNRAAGLLLLLTAAGLQKWDVARAVALDFHRRFTTLQDLPLVPAAAKHAHGAELPMFPSRTAVFGAADLIEELGADRVLLTFATIPTRIDCNAEQVTALAQLGERYKQRAAMRMAPTDSNSPEISELDSGSSRPH